MNTILQHGPKAGQAFCLSGMDVHFLGTSRPGPAPKFTLLLTLLCLLFSASTGRAALQFDAFPGYDGIVPEASWFPVVCEVKNDGPTFKAMIELTGSAVNQGQTIRMPVELPTGTLKRLVLPVFSSTRGYTSWDLRLLDERGRIR